jgi:hypothetical protein
MTFYTPDINRCNHAEHACFILRSEYWERKYESRGKKQDVILLKYRSTEKYKEVREHNNQKNSGSKKSSEVKKYQKKKYRKCY